MRRGPALPGEHSCGSWTPNPQRGPARAASRLGEAQTHTRDTGFHPPISGHSLVCPPAPRHHESALPPWTRLFWMFHIMSHTTRDFVSGFSPQCFRDPSTLYCVSGLHPFSRPNKPIYRQTLSCLSMCQPPEHVRACGCASQAHTHNNPLWKSSCGPGQASALEGGPGRPCLT